MAERSKGFIWLFSFLAAFSEYVNEGRRIILLDEPGLNLHAKAQNDLLRFIDDRLAPHHQVIYSTHSLFMIEPTKLDRCRTVEDVDDAWHQGQSGHLGGPCRHRLPAAGGARGRSDPDADHRA
jgi:predicted ATP-dependent endonuclease of OLD family